MVTGGLEFALRMEDVGTRGEHLRHGVFVLLDHGASEGSMRRRGRKSDDVSPGTFPCLFLFLFQGLLGFPFLFRLPVLPEGDELSRIEIAVGTAPDWTDPPVRPLGGVFGIEASPAEIHQVKSPMVGAGFGLVNEIHGGEAVFRLQADLLDHDEIPGIAWNGNGLDIVRKGAGIDQVLSLPVVRPRCGIETTGAEDEKEREEERSDLEHRGHLPENDQETCDGVSQ